MNEYHGWSPLLVFVGLGHMAFFAAIGITYPRTRYSAALFACVPGLQLVLAGLLIDRGRAVMGSAVLGSAVVAIGGTWWVARRARARHAERRSVPS